MKIAIYGCGGFGREVAPLALENGAEVIFISDTPADHGTVAGLPCLPLRDVPHDFGFVVAVADAKVRRRLVEKAEAHGLEPASVISRTARLLGWQEIAAGAIICDFVTITDNVRIGRHFHANLYAYIGHDCDLGEFVTLGPQAGVNGNSRIGSGTYLATGATMRHGTPVAPFIVGANVVVGMGAVVTKPVPDGAVVYGNPARVVTTAPVLREVRQSGERPARADGPRRRAIPALRLAAGGSAVAKEIARDVGS